MLAPAVFNAKLVGSYTPGQNAFSAQATNVRIAPGRNDAPIYQVYETPMFRDAFRDLGQQPDGSLNSNGERKVSVGCTTKFSLTLRRKAE